MTQDNRRTADRPTSGNSSKAFPDGFNSTACARLLNRGGQAVNGAVANGTGFAHKRDDSLTYEVNSATIERLCVVKIRSSVHAQPGLTVPAKRPQVSNG